MYVISSGMLTPVERVAVPSAGSLWSHRKTRGPRDPAVSTYLRFSIFVFRLLDPLIKGNANAAHRSGRGHNAGLGEARPGAARPVFRGVRQCGVAARSGCDARLA